MTITYIPTKQVKDLIAVTFPDYRKRQVGIQAAETVTLHDLNWCGGTKSDYVTVTIDGHRLADTEKYSMQHPANNRAEGVTLPIPKGIAVVRGGFFCGKTSTITIYVHPSDMPKLLPAPETDPEGGSKALRDAHNLCFGGLKFTD